MTGERSSLPVRAVRRAMSSGLVAGTMRSTMVEGKRPSASIQSARAGSRRRARSRVTARTTRPFSGRLSQQRTVKGGHAGRVAAGEGGDEKARRRARGVGVGEVVDDVGMVGVEPAGGGLVAVALFGDGEGDDADGRVGHGGEDGGGVFAGDEDVLDDVDDPGGLAVRGRVRGRCRRSPGGRGRRAGRGGRG